MMRFRHFILLLLLIVPLASCATDPEPDKEKDFAAWSSWSFRQWERDIRALRTPADLFPTATTIKVYAGRSSVRTMPDGRVLTSVRLPGGGFDNEAAPIDGGVLTPEEVQLMRKSVSWIPSPPAVRACCIPRHAFTFFDSAGNYLGGLAVCFECKCARLQPYPTSPNRRTTLFDWDMDAFAKIVQAHGLPTDPQNLPE
jgi:hypothetical protein